MKVGLLNGDTTVVVFIPFKKEILQSFIQYLAHKNINFINN